MDFRFRPIIGNWINTELNGRADLIAMAGASAAINNEESRSVILNYVKIAVELHSATQVYIIDHIDCGAYCGSKQHANLEDEIAMHTEELSKSKNIIKETFSNLEAFTFTFDFKNVIEA